MAPEKPITIKEIAKRAGVSVSTVSRVMGGKETAIQISEDTRQKIMLVCEELKFLPNANYSRLQNRHSRIIGFLVPKVGENSPNPLIFMDENIGIALSALEDYLMQRRYSLLIQAVDEQYEESREHQKILRNNTVDALIVWDAFRKPETVHELGDEHRPCINVALPNASSRSFIVPDNYQGAFDMTQHLVRHGHTRIAYIGGMSAMADELREKGYREAVAKNNIEPIVYSGGYRFEGGYQAAEKILNKHPGVTAIFAANDTMAIGVLEYCRSIGKSIPEDVAIAGFDGSSYSNYTTPKLTTCKLPMEEIGRLAAENAVDMIESGKTREIQMTLPVQIIEKESTLGWKK